MFSLVYSAVNMTLVAAFAAELRAAALLLPGARRCRYLLHVRRSAANPLHTAAAFD